MSHTENTPLLEVRNLKKYFGKKDRVLHAVDDISVTIQQGKTLGVVGESGCGKSTLGRTVLRLLEPTDGQIIFDGQDITHVSEREMRKYRQSMQIIFQDPYSSLNPRYCIFELISEPLRTYHLCANKQALQKRVFELMDEVSLARRYAYAYPHELDGGRRQRVGIACALALEPELIVCDEPVSALDVSIQAQVLNLLQDLQEEKGLTYIFVTHDLSVVKHISDDIMVMYVGCTVEKCAAEELFQAPLHPYTKGLLSAIPVLLGTLAADSVAAPERIMLPCVSLLLAMVAVAVYLFVRVGMVQGSFQRLLEEGDYTREGKRAARSPIVPIYWCLVTAAYLAWSFITMAWDRTWIVWPVAGVLFAAVVGIIRMTHKEGQKEKKAG